MSETNGQSRLDRIEAILDRHSTMIVTIEVSIERRERANEAAERANQAAHERFEEDGKRLFTAQILMNRAMEKMLNGIIVLEVKMQEMTEKLNALISTVDGIIRKPDRPQA